MEFDARLLPDHHFFVEKDLLFESNAPIIMTEKDAVKCHELNQKLGNTLYYLRARSELTSSFKEAFMKKLNQTSLRLASGEKK